MRVAILFAAMLAACTPAPGGKDSAAPAAPPAFAPDTGVVFAGEKARELTEPCSRPPPSPVTGVWTPPQAQIAAMEQALAQLVAEQLAAQWPAEAISVQSYRRQYGGLIVGGRRIIAVNGFRHDDEIWRTYPMTICDGGPIMFGVEYDPETREFRNFAFNGVA